MHRTFLFTIFLLLISLANLACQTSPSIVSDTVAPTPAGSPAAPLTYEDIIVGDGRRAIWGGTASITYVGKLTNGFIFDEGKFDYKLGDQGIIKGFNLGVGGGQGIEAMRVGGKRKIVVPPELGYGANGNGTKIPPNSTLIFEIELVKMQGELGF